MSFPDTRKTRKGKCKNSRLQGELFVSRPERSPKVWVIWTKPSEWRLVNTKKKDDLQSPLPLPPSLFFSSTELSINVFPRCLFCLIKKNTNKPYILPYRLLHGFCSPKDEILSFLFFTLLHKFTATKHLIMILSLLLFSPVLLLKNNVMYLWGIVL